MAGNRKNRYSVKVRIVEAILTKNTNIFYYSSFVNFFKLFGTRTWSNVYSVFYKIHASCTNKKLILLCMNQKQKGVPKTFNL